MINTTCLQFKKYYNLHRHFRKSKKRSQCGDVGYDEQSCSVAFNTLYLEKDTYMFI